jgi:hypothetical protein
MKRSRASLYLLRGVAAAALITAIPAFGQDDPESLLPPGFGDPATVPPPEKEPDRTPVPAPPPSSTPSAVPAAGPDGEAVEESSEDDLDDILPIDLISSGIELPDHARRPTDCVGPLTPGTWGFAENAFGAANGRFLTGLMGRLDAPLPSRWTSILLRRLLLSRLAPATRVAEVDWVAERAWLLLRMGEADAARILVQSIDVDQYTPRMFTVAVQTALATADPAALCPLVQPGRATSDEPIWPLADAMCAALAGDAARASQLIDQARSRSGAGGVDLLLAEKVVGAGLDSRRAVDIDWQGVNELTSWRFGIATATGMEIPQRLIASAPANLRAWQARAPMVPVEQRTAAAHAAASLGVFSNSSLVEMYSLIADTTDPNDIESSMGGRLRRAYAARAVADRVEAMRAIWDEAQTPDERHARLVLTAAAASLVPPSAEQKERAADLIASMLTGGLDRQAARWSAVVDDMGGDGDSAWALLALSGANPKVDMSSGRVESFASRDGGHRGQMLVAGLSGLGRYGNPASLGVDPTPVSRWARSITAAARNNQPGTVVLLAGIGMQTPDWRGVPPSHLYHIVRSLRAVGLEYEARMIAAEALSRL